MKANEDSVRKYPNKKLVNSDWCNKIRNEVNDLMSIHHNLCKTSLFSIFIHSQLQHQISGECIICAGMAPPKPFRNNGKEAF